AATAPAAGAGPAGSVPTATSRGGGVSGPTAGGSVAMRASAGTSPKTKVPGAGGTSHGGGVAAGRVATGVPGGAGAGEYAAAAMNSEGPRPAPGSTIREDSGPAPRPSSDPMVDETG